MNDPGREKKTHDSAVPPLPSLEQSKALLARSLVWGWLSAILFFIAAMAVADSLQSLIRHEFNSIDLVPGERLLVSGMLPADAQEHSDLVVQVSGDAAITFTPLETYRGFWMGGRMWRAELVAAPDALPGNAVVTVRDILPSDDKRNTPFAGLQNPALVFDVRLWPSESARRSADTSLFRRVTGLPAFGVAVGVFFLAALAGMANWRSHAQAEKALARNGVFFIYGIKKLNGTEQADRFGPHRTGYETTFDLAERENLFQRGDAVLLLDRKWRKQGEGGIVKVNESKGTAQALFPLDGARPRYGWLVRRDRVETALGETGGQQYD